MSLYREAKLHETLKHGDLHVKRRFRETVGGNIRDYLLVIANECQLPQGMEQYGSDVSLSGSSSLLGQHDSRHQGRNQATVLGQPCCCAASNLNALEFDNLHIIDPAIDFQPLAGLAVSHNCRPTSEITYSLICNFR